MTNDAELLRLRDKFHRFEKQQWATHELARSSERRLVELARRVDRLEERVDDMTEADRIAAAVATGIRHDRAKRWTLPRKLATVLLSIIVAVPAVHDLAAWLP